MKTILNFSKSQTPLQIHNELSRVSYEYMQLKKDFSVQFGIEKTAKSHPQLKACYQLFKLCRPHFQKWKPTLDWDLEAIKEFTKAQLGYTRSPSSFEVAMMIKQSGFIPKDEEEKKKMVRFYKKIKQNISFAEFTKEQAFNFVKELEVWAQEKGWSDVYLTDEEKEAMNEYYKLTER